MSSNSKIFACSDHHFFHKNIIKYANRPFDINDINCVGDCAEYMIKQHNETVDENDYVIFVGDLSAGLRHREEMFSLMLKHLNGNKILVKGNHDYCSDEFYLNSGFQEIHDYIIYKKYFISHYPCAENKYNKPIEKSHIKKLHESNCDTIIHGHIHNKHSKDCNMKENDKYNRINACVDYAPNDFKPIEVDKILIGAFGCQ